MRAATQKTIATTATKERIIQSGKREGSDRSAAFIRSKAVMIGEESEARQSSTARNQMCKCQFHVIFARSSRNCQGMWPVKNSARVGATTFSSGVRAAA